MTEIAMLSSMMQHTQHEPGTAKFVVGMSANALPMDASHAGLLGRYRI